MKNYELAIKNKSTSHQANVLRIIVALILAAFTSHQGFAQVSATIDSTSIRIGDELRYKMKVEADSTQIVVFPEGKTFTPLEVIESYKIDTAKNGNKLGLTKEYALTQFDSGQYTIPRQKVMVGDQIFFTDSLKVEVRDVLVDTTKQKMFEIKPMSDVDASFFNWKKYIWWILTPLIIIGLIAFLLFRRKNEKMLRKTNFRHTRRQC